MRTRTIRLVQEILDDNLEVHPEKVALICDGRRLTYAQIDGMANRLANALFDRGVRRGDRILIYLLNSVEAVVSVFAALKAGAIFSVVDYATKPDKLASIAADCTAMVLITHGHQAELAAQLMEATPSLKFALLTGEAGGWQGAHAADFLSFDSIQESYAPDPLPQECIDRDLAYLVYTSGSTGEPKGVMTTHQSSLFAIQIAIEYLGLAESDVIASPLPLSYSHGFNQLLKTLRVGGTLLLEKSFAYPAVTLKKVESERATGFAGVPTVLTILMQLDLSRYDLSALRYFSSAGAALPSSLIEQMRQRFPNVAIFSMYGMAEASNAFGLDPRQIDVRPTSVGKPLPGTEAWLSGEEGQRLEANEIGELIVRGGHVRCGYWNDAEVSAYRLWPGELPGELVCHTGDMFRMDDAGYFYFVGRGDEIIKSGGKKVPPKEVENALYSLKGVLEAAAIGVPDPLLGQAIKVFVVLDPEVQPPLTETAILRHCREMLEEFMVPRHVEIRDSLPKTGSGKIKKIDLA